MSKKTEPVSENLETPNVIDNTDANEISANFKGILDTLVPPKSINIEDIFGNKYELVSAISARKQIKVIRMFDEIKEILSNVQVTNITSDFVQLISSLAQDEQVLSIICKCFNLAHPSVVKNAKDHADELNYEYSDDEQIAADLFSIEELVTAIFPLFIRLARRTSQAMSALTKMM